MSDARINLLRRRRKIKKVHQVSVENTHQEKKENSNKVDESRKC